MPSHHHSCGDSAPLRANPPGLVPRFTFAIILAIGLSHTGCHDQVSYLGHSSDHWARQLITKSYYDRTDAVTALRAGSRDSDSVLVELLGHPNSVIRIIAAEVLSSKREQPPEVTQALIAALGDGNLAMQHEVIDALKNRGVRGVPAIGPLLKLAEAGHGGVRRLAFTGACQLIDSTDEHLTADQKVFVLSSLFDECTEIRAAAVWLCGQQHLPQSYELLRDLAQNDPRSKVRHVASRSLQLVGESHDMADFQLASEIPAADWEMIRKHLISTRPKSQLSSASIELIPEFNASNTILMSWQDNYQNSPGTFEKLAREASLASRLLIVAPSPAQVAAVNNVLRRLKISEKCHVISAPVHSVWIRDFEPLSAIRDGKRVLFGFDIAYRNSKGESEFAARMAEMNGFEYRSIPIVADGGMILHNGNGVIVMSYGILERNVSTALGRNEITKIIQHEFPNTEVVFLEPLQGEESRHIDLTVTFTSANSVVVGDYDADVDPVNHALLNRNAARLAAVRTGNGSLRVARVPMPDNHDGVWRTYTNVTYANGTLLVPSYKSVSDETERRALEVFQSELPDWRIVPVDCSKIIEYGGALHCITTHL